MSSYHVANWDQVVPMVEFACNSSVSQPMGRNPFWRVTCLLPRKPIDLVPLPIEARPRVEADAFDPHIRDV